MYRENIQKTMQNYCLPIERAFLIIFLNYSAADSDTSLVHLVLNVL